MIKKKIVTILALLLPLTLSAQINIGGAVFGGARQANVGGHTNVDIKASETNLDIIINAVYGGNDIAGEIATNADTTTVPANLTAAEENNINNTYSIIG